MKIILQENVEKLGTRGQVVEVKEGYARNYLLPRALAIAATPGNMKRLEKIRITLAKKEAEEKGAAELLAQQLAAVSLTVARKAGENDQLFGSVTAADISDGLAAQGFTIDKRRVQLAEPIKVISENDVAIKLHHDVTATIKVSVTREA